MDCIAASGFSVAIPDYRLYPEARFPDFVEDTAAAVAWLAGRLPGALELVVVVDASPDNMLRFFFNVDYRHNAGWARALIDGNDWRDAGLRYTFAVYERTQST